MSVDVFPSFSIWFVCFLIAEFAVADHDHGVGPAGKAWFVCDEQSGCSGVDARAQQFHDRIARTRYEYEHKTNVSLE